MYTVAEEASGRIIRPSGDMTADTAEQLRDHLLKILTEDTELIRFDLSGVDDIAAAPFSVLVTLAEMAERRDPRLRIEIANAAKDIETLFQMTCLDRVYRIV